jgi:hypothetical protein
MPKSIDRPMNMTAKAIEMRLSDPIATAANPNVNTSPRISVMKHAAISLNDRSAVKRSPSTIRIEAIRPQPVPSATVPNSSSLRAMGPVRRTVTPFAGVRFSSFAISRTAAVALAPGCSARKSRLGCARISLRSSRGSTGRSIIRDRQEIGVSLPDSAALVADAMAESGRSSEAKSVALRATPSIASESTSNRPRRLGSPARLAMKGCARMIDCETCCRALVSRNSKP